MLKKGGRRLALISSQECKMAACLPTVMLGLSVCHASYTLQEVTLLYTPRDHSQSHPWKLHTLQG